jgi:sulfite exporter TauE/SafE
MTLGEFSIPLGLGLVSSLHCVGMCGPLVLAWSLPMRQQGRGMIKAHLGYHAGRILTYSLMGAVAGLAGAGLASLGQLAGIEKTAAIVIGTAMVVAGLLMFRLLPRSSLVQIGTMPSFLSRTSAKFLRSGSTLPLGVALGFLPCGLVYAALLKAAASATALDGALNMFAFGLGTTPSLLGIGAFSSLIPQRLMRHSTLLAAIFVTLLGAYMVWRGIKVPLPGAGSCHHGI